jgi:hypothetical protein
MKHSGLNKFTAPTGAVFTAVDCADDLSCKGCAFDDSHAEGVFCWQAPRCDARDDGRNVIWVLKRDHQFNLATGGPVSQCFTRVAIGYANLGRDFDDAVGALDRPDFLPAGSSVANFLGDPASTAYPA